MKKKLEGVVQKEILNYLKSKSIYVVKTMRMNVNGVPDILCCHHGYFIAIEVKAEGKINSTSELQKIQLASIRKAGGIAFVADTLDTVIERIEELEDALL